ncbi:uncharacterized protein LOC111693784 [Trichogramma pretiosum]|uniref:uncharacterized protein LOC111693784 n=1 Tax=Trichogramma pretiosum TaxID=7493 RepID=UPI000C71BFE6|nr:uncharacterized protein LOC111693784 [Trichogramma pretiosum]
MEISENTVRVKEEPKASDDIVNLVDSCEVKHLETFSFHTSSANNTNEPVPLQKKLDEEIFIDIEWKDVKPQILSISKIVCKNEYQNYPPIVKIKNENQISSNICKTEGQCCLSTVKIENQTQTYYSMKKSPIILIKKDFDYYSNRKFQVNSQLKFERNKESQQFKKITYTKLFDKGKTNRQNYKRETNLNTHINATQERIRPKEWKICNKQYKSALKTHLRIVHNRSFECEICHKSFGRKCTLKTHINAYMMKENHPNVRFVKNHLDKNNTSKLILMQYISVANPSNYMMKENHSNVRFVKNHLDKNNTSKLILMQYISVANPLNVRCV